jgi:hypothetical protein
VVWVDRRIGSNLRVVLNRIVGNMGSTPWIFTTQGMAIEFSWSPDAHYFLFGIVQPDHGMTLDVVDTHAEPIKERDLQFAAIEKQVAAQLPTRHAGGFAHHIQIDFNHFEWLSSTQAINFLDEKNGFLLNSSDPAAGLMKKEVFGTQDGGKYWASLTSPNIKGVRFYTTGIAFRSPKVGWVTGTYHGVPDAPLFRTEDGGKSWSLQKLTFPPDYQGGYADIYPPVFIGADKMHGYLPVKLDRHEPQPNHYAWVNYESTDGGMTWQLPAWGVQSSPWD